MKQIKTAEQSREEVAQILRDNITFSPQTQAYVIHGAIDKLIEWRRAYAEQFIEAAAMECSKRIIPGYHFQDPTLIIVGQAILKLKEHLKWEYGQ